MAHRTSHIAHRTSPDSLPLSGRIQEIDALRGFAIFLVVLGHSIIIFPINLHENFYCNSIFVWLSSVHMPMMFMISGFCWSCRDYGTYIRRKFLRIAVPYIIFNLIDMFPRHILSSFVNRPLLISESVMKLLFFGGQYWFLYTLFVIFMIYPLIFRLASSSRTTMLILCAALAVLAVYGVNISAFMIGSAAHYMFFFHAGVTAKYILGGKLPDVKIPVFILPVTFVIWLLLLFGTQGFGIIVALIGISACYMMTQYSIFNRIFSRFGEYSLQLYLLNGFTLGISRAIICNVLHVSQPAVIIAFNMLIDFFASYLLIKYVFAKSRIMRVIMGMP
ncbi:MAG: acyltransferase [Synergistaceae bacterium]|nr:acyltransferase [Synergistaceae bacterium]